MTVQAVTAEVPGEGLLMTLTGGNAYTGGTSTVAGAPDWRRDQQRVD